MRRNAEQALQALARLAAPRARVLRDRREREIDAREVVPGDVVLLESGARVPADLRLLRVVDLQVDESILTGESLPVTKAVEPIPDPNAPVAERRNLAFLGTSVSRGRGAGVAVATGMQTEFGRISVQVSRSAGRNPPGGPPGEPGRPPCPRDGAAHRHAGQRVHGL